jgi:hypothetical protein
MRMEVSDNERVQTWRWSSPLLYYFSTSCLLEE